MPNLHLTAGNLTTLLTTLKAQTSLKPSKNKKTLKTIAQAGISFAKQLGPSDVQLHRYLKGYRHIMTEYLLFFLALATSIGLLFFSYKKLTQKSYAYAASGLTLSLPVILTTALLANLLIDDGTIKRLTREHTIATIAFTNVGDHHFRASFTEPHQAPVEYDIFGDQWQVDARILKWNGLAAKAGLKPMYQFERLSGRYQDVQLEMNSKRSVYALVNTDENAEKNNSGSIWGYLIKYQEYVPWLDSQYGSATYMPMQHGAVFTIKLSQNGLLARPRNFVASQSLKHWL